MAMTQVTAAEHESAGRWSNRAQSHHPMYLDLPATLPRFVSRDYSRRAVHVCVLDARGKILGHHACADEPLRGGRRFGVVRGAAVEA